jgi:hypothetical protein
MGRRLAELSVFAGLLIAGLAPPAPAAVVPNQVIIRVYDNFGLPTAARIAAIAAASDILKQASVEVEWRDCRAGFGVCSKAPRPTELVVRLVRVPAGVAEHTLGESVIDTTGWRGAFATIYADRVDTMALTARTNRAQALGRVMAHEIGHLLLGTPEHSASGLMRKLSSPQDLQTTRREDWLFTASQRDYLWREQWFATVAPSPRKPFSGG